MESEADRIVGLYRRHARAWAEARGDRLIETPWLDRLIGLLPESPAVLDIGCGPGVPIGRYLMERGCRLTGVDSAPEMIALAQSNLAEGNLEKGGLPQATWLVADMRSLDLGRAFQGILAWDSFFHLRQEDQRRMFPVFRRHAAPRAALLFTSGPSRGESMGSFQGEPLYHASLDPSEYRALLDENGFEVVAHMVEYPACGRHTVWLARLR
ncbi:class I SAM-dependent methyltransferase [Fundidesulfovibrio agrisoli]|uniref:class I SAM-dependent methyltransferase n=1 Tax=Fundidesulfovibrio agrisoli TaxID=2922717 RepID=UPI001FAD8643|nr:class I SAM-dependent methyltransferase [Fundidesulfovibrio agrisoli]